MFEFLFRLLGLATSIFQQRQDDTAAKRGAIEDSDRAALEELEAIRKAQATDKGMN